MYMRGEDRTPFDASPNLGTPKTTRRVRVRLAGGVNVGSGVLIFRLLGSFEA